MTYRALKKRIASLKSPVSLNDRKEYPFLSFLKKDFPRIEFLLTQPDLVIITDEIPEISFSRYRFIQAATPEWIFLRDYIETLDRKVPILFEEKSNMADHAISLGFKLLQRTANNQADIILDGQGWFLPQYPEPISAKPFRASLPIPPRKDYLNQQLLIDVLSNFLVDDLIDLALDYLSVEEKLVRQWPLPKGPRNTPVYDFTVSPQGEVYVLVKEVEDRKSFAHIQVLSPEGKLKREWRVTDQSVRRIALSPNGLMVYGLDPRDGEVVVMTHEGGSIEEWNTFYHKYVTFNKIKVSPNGNIYLPVKSVEEGEPEPPILVYSPEGELIQDIHLPEHDTPEDIAFLGNEIFVIGADKRNIYVLSQEGSPIGTIEMPKEFSPELIFDPSAIAISSEGEIYVLSRRLHDRVYVFNVDGVFLREFKPLKAITRLMAIGPQDEIYLLDELEEGGFYIRVFKKGY
jgi:hypothetical protein